MKYIQVHGVSNSYPELDLENCSPRLKPTLFNYQRQEAQWMIDRYCLSLSPLSVCPVLKTKG